jgi:hypothetical protein
MRLLYKLLILGVIFVFTAGSAMASSAVLEAVGGSEVVTVKRAGQTLKLRQGERLEAGDEVVTDGKTAVDVRMEDRTLIRVGANSTYKLEEDSKAKRLFHRLLHGIVRVMVPARAEGKGGDVRFRMNTPEGTIGVRGTEFVVIRGKDETTIKGLNGSVMFGPADADFEKPEAFVAIRGGLESSVKKGGMPSEPKGFNVPSYLKELSGQRGRFGALSSRGASVRTRSAPAEKAAVAVAKKGQQAPKARTAGVTQSTTAPSKKTESPDEMLFLAAGDGDVDRAKEALSKGADVNYQDRQGHSPLHAAVFNSRDIMITFLLEQGADVNVKNRVGETPLMLVASDSANAAVGLLLIEAPGSRIKETNRSRKTALDLARIHLDSDPGKEKKVELEKLITILEEEMKK